MPGLFWELYDRTIAPSVVTALETDLHQGLVRRAKPGAHILDVGSGGGQHAVRIAGDRPDLRVTGIDNAPVMVKRSQQLARRRGVADRCAFSLGDALDLPFEDNSFDHLYTAGPLKQVTDPERVMRECVRVLKPGGTLLAMEVDRGASYEDIEAMVSRAHLPRPLKSVLRLYFSTYVVAQSIDLDDARRLWAPLNMQDSDGPRRVPDQPVLIMIGRKP